MNPVTIPNNLPAEIVAIDAAIMIEAQALKIEAEACDPQTAEDLEHANRVYAQADDMAKGISKQRLEITRPIDELKKAIIAAEREATEPLTIAYKDLGQRIAACTRKLDAERREAERKAREEAEAKAAAQRKRLAEEAEKRRKEEAEKAELFGVEPEHVPEPEPVVPVVEAPVAKPAPIKSAVSTRKMEQVVIHDEAALLAAACEDNGKLFGRLVLKIDEKAVKALAKAGCGIPGVRIDVTEQTVRARR